jgi:hypothetical protein
VDTNRDGVIDRDEYERERWRLRRDNITESRARGARSARPRSASPTAQVLPHPCSPPPRHHALDCQMSANMEPHYSMVGWLEQRGNHEEAEKLRALLQDMERVQEQRLARPQREYDRSMSRSMSPPSRQGRTGDMELLAAVQGVRSSGSLSELIAQA